MPFLQRVLRFGFSSPGISVLPPVFHDVQERNRLFVSKLFKTPVCANVKTVPFILRIPIEKEINSL